MSRLRHLLIGGALGALAIGAIGAPVGAADTKGTLAIVNGIPGRTVDVCLDGKEIKSRLRYGKVVLRDVVSTGNKSLKLYAADPRTCKGNVVAQKSFPLAAGDDLTIVATKNAPKVVTFVNTGLGEIPPTGAPYPATVFFHRHAGDMLANVFIRYWAPIPDTPVSPSALPLWGKGQKFATTFGAQDYVWQMRVTRPEDPDTVAFKKVTTALGRRYEFIFVGTNARNGKIVLVNRRVSLPSP